VAEGKEWIRSCSYLFMLRNQHELSGLDLRMYGSSVAFGLSVRFVSDHMSLSACVLALLLVVGVMAVPPSLHFVLLHLGSWFGVHAPFGT
jgi:uncharacterized membrane protein YphA (DoxX/SURF4 family)